MVERSMREKTPVASQVFKEGASLMLWGVLETLRSEARSAACMGVIGAMWGIGVGVVKNESLMDHALKSAKSAGRWGAIWGWSGAASQYNEYAQKRGLPTVQWYDNILGGILAYRAYKQATPFQKMDQSTSLVMTQLVNPITLLGIRRIGQSAVMALGT